MSRNKSIGLVIILILVIFLNVFTWKNSDVIVDRDSQRIKIVKKYNKKINKAVKDYDKQSNSPEYKAQLKKQQAMQNNPQAKMAMAKMSKAQIAAMKEKAMKSNPTYKFAMKLQKTQKDYTKAIKDQNKRFDKQKNVYTEASDTYNNKDRETLDTKSLALFKDVKAKKDVNHIKKTNSKQNKKVNHFYKKIKKNRSFYKNEEKMRVGIVSVILLIALAFAMGY